MTSKPEAEAAPSRAVPDNTAARTALWRAMHVQVDQAPHVLTDEIGLALLDPPHGWQQRRDMNRDATARNRASIVARACYVEDLVQERSTDNQCLQYVILGAGLDSYAQRSSVPHVVVFEVDQPDTQQWKRERLRNLGLSTSGALRFVPFDFESAGSWLDALVEHGYMCDESTVVSCLGVSMYLSTSAVRSLLEQVAALGEDVTLVLSFLIPLDDVDANEQVALRGAEHGARANGTPWVSFFEPHQLIALARDCGFAAADHVTPNELDARYFAARSDGLRPSSAEHLIVASTSDAPRPGNRS
jgi:methyltransferase (TIGR00027 family)